MYSFLLSLHNITRWLAFVALVLAVLKAAVNLKNRKGFTPFDNQLRHLTATFFHLQLVIGIWLYMESPVAKSGIQHLDTADDWFFGLLHPFMMLTAIVLVTIGSSVSKRQIPDKQYALMLKWYAIVLLIILLMIPWSFSPLVSRPLLRTF